MSPHLILAVAPQPSWAGILTAVAVVLLNVGGVVTAVSLALNRRRTSKRLDADRALDKAYRRDTTEQLGVIHGLVNNTLTVALQDQLDASRRELTMMQELTSMRQESGAPVSQDWLAATGSLRRKVDELGVRLTDRAAQTRAADIRIATAAARREDERANAEEQ